MTIQFEKPQEAYAALASLAIAADGQGTLQERDALFGAVSQYDVFASSSEADVRALVGVVTERLYSQLATGEVPSLDAAAVDQVIAASNEVLDDSQRREAYAMASRLCASDGQGAGELDLINRIHVGFGLS